MPPSSNALRTRIEDLANTDDAHLDEHAAGEAVRDLLDALNQGHARAASRRSDGTWTANAWVKQGILLGFRLGQLKDYSNERFPFFDKDTYPLKPLNIEDNVRLVPGGSAVRTGAYLASGVVCMPPMYVNVGAYVDEGAMIDSHALVGSCAQIGRGVHLSASAQIGGVLEPVGARPVIIEDGVFVGGGAGVYEGCLVREGAVLAPGVMLTGATRVFDTARERMLEQKDDEPLVIPERAVVVPGSRAVDSDFGDEHGLSLYSPIIVKYRDAKTDAATTLETALR